MSESLRWPADRFYWAVLDASVLPTGVRATEEKLGYLLESALPEPLEAVHAIYVQTAKQEYVACAVSKSVLESVPPETLTLSPESLPLFVTSGIDPRRFNVLTKEHLPASLQKSDRRWIAQCAATAILAAGLLIIGFERRAAAMATSSTRIESALGDVYQNALGYRPGSSPLPPELRAEAELRALRKTRNPQLSSLATRDAAATLESILRRWPADLVVEVDSFSVTSDAIHLDAKVKNPEDAQRLATSLGSFDSFTQEIPSIRTTNDVTQVALDWRRTAPEKR